MKPAIFGVSALAAVLLGSVCLAADDAAKSKSETSAQTAGAQASSGATEKGARAQQPRAARLTKPWRDLSSLSEDQKKQIADIHRKSVQDQKVIEEREKADIMALLNDQQKAELKALLDQEAAERKTRSANRPAARSGGAAGDNANKKADSNEAAATPAK